jgi:hypothetical protein
MKIVILSEAKNLKVGSKDFLRVYPELTEGLRITLKFKDEIQ